MSLGWAALALAAAGLLQEAPASRAWVLRGALLVGLAAAALTAMVGHANTAQLGVDPTTVVSREFLQLVFGLCLLGGGVALAGSRQWPSILGVILLVVAAWPLHTIAGWVRPLGVAAGVLALVLLGAAASRVARPGRILEWLDRALLDRQGRAEWRPPPSWAPTAPLLVMAVCAAAALAIPHLLTVLGGSVIGMAVAWGLDRRRWFVAVAGSLLLVALIWSLHLAGPIGGWIPALIDGPFSARAERWLALSAAVGVAALAGLWPVHGVTVPVLLAPLAIAVGGLWAWRLLPAGVEFWQPLFAPLAVLAAVHAGRRGRWPALLVALGAYGLWTASGAGVVAGSILIASGWFLAVLPTTWLGRLPVPTLLTRLAGLLPAAGVLLLLQAGLATEVTYTVLLATMVGVAVGSFGERAPDPPR